MEKAITIYFKGMKLTCTGDHDRGEHPIWNAQFEINEITMIDDDGRACSILSVFHELNQIEEITELCIEEIKN
jgi:hypothetical protein